MTCSFDFIFDVIKELMVILCIMIIVFSSIIVWIYFLQRIFKSLNLRYSTVQYYFTMINNK